MATKLFGFPVSNYFDDVGHPLPTALSAKWIATVSTFRDVRGARVGRNKNDLVEKGAFVGLRDAFPGPDTNMLPPLDLRRGDMGKWRSRIEIFRKSGITSRKELESLSGRLPFSHTAIFGMFGRAATHPNYRKLNADFRQNRITASGGLTFGRVDGFLMDLRLRIVHLHRNTRQKFIYADASTESISISSVYTDKDAYDRAGRIEACMWSYGTRRTGGIDRRSQSYLRTWVVGDSPNGCGAAHRLGRKCVFLYIGNLSDKGALIKADSKRSDISVHTLTFWEFVEKDGLPTGLGEFGRIVIYRIYRPDGPRYLIRYMRRRISCAAKLFTGRKIRFCGHPIGCLARLD